MREIRPKWSAGGVALVCEKCSRVRMAEESPEFAARLEGFDLRAWLKDELKRHGEWGPVRVVSSSCLDVCARERVTVALAPVDGPVEVLAVDPFTEREELYGKIVALRRKPS